MPESLSNYPVMMLDTSRIKDEEAKLAIDAVAVYLSGMLNAMALSLETYSTTVKAWGNFSVSGGVPTLDDGFGFSSTIVDNGGNGDFTLTFLVPFDSANYGVMVQALQATATDDDSKTHTQTATTVRVLVRTGGAAADVDFNVVVFGVK